MSSLISLKDVTKIYRTSEVETLALDQVSLEVEQGEYIAIVGTSGSGKSTMLNILGLLDNATSGSYFLAGEDVTALDDDAQTQRRLATFGFVFQQFNLMNRSSVAANVALPMLYKGVKKKDRDQRVLELLALMDISEKLHSKPNQLSGGQKQRVAFARALANYPQIILADEPTGALDSRNTASILDLMATLNNLGNTILVVTHDMDVARAAKRIISLKDGRIVSDELVDKEKLDKPAKKGRRKKT
ncbi:MAG: ABC transporter ATP-binding protein [Erysipelotrichaceae bacterium]|jgi:putative ABC transport system ATP-binding protein|nr:ABC transporter ATP-binding protein [Erysipelotrichaceae bacterium]